MAGASRIRSVISIAIAGRLSHSTRTKKVAVAGRKRDSQFPRAGERERHRDGVPQKLRRKVPPKVRGSPGMTMIVVATEPIADG